MLLKYGKENIELEISRENLLGSLESKEIASQPLDQLLKQSTLDPIGRPRLSHLLRKNKPQDLVIVVSDKTRAIANYAKILEFLVTEIIDAGIDEKNIEFVIALGTHAPHTVEENNSLYGDLPKTFHFAFHDCHQNLVSLGKTSTGLEVQVNKRVWDADFVIITGRIDFHYLAGFSGGRKSVMPGIASYATIRDNHCKLRRNGVALARIENNPIAQEMDEACRLLGVQYLLNVVETPNKKTNQVFCGHPEFAFRQGVEYFTALRTMKIPKVADCTIVSAGGYPKDRDFFNSQKSLNFALNTLKPHGSIILIAQCAEGFGNENFLRYLSETSIDELLNYREQKIEVGGHRAFVTAEILKEHKVYVLSDLEPSILSRMSFTPVSNGNDAHKLVVQEHGADFRAYVMPEGKAVLPVMN